MKRIWKFLAIAGLIVGLFGGADLPAQIIIQDHNGPNLYVAGTQGDDIVFVWEKAGELLVSVNGRLTNVTKETGVTVATLYSVGTNLFGGDDIISYRTLPQLDGGTTTNGGLGVDEVVEGPSDNRGTDIAHWTIPNAESTTANDPATGSNPPTNASGPNPGPTVPPQFNEMPTIPVPALPGN